MRRSKRTRSLIFALLVVLSFRLPHGSFAFHSVPLSPRSVSLSEPRNTLRPVAVLLESTSIGDDERRGTTTKSIISSYVEPLLFSTPFAAAAIAFGTHRPLSVAFHNLFYSYLSTSEVWDSSSSEVMDLVRAGLNGPVATSIAILFGCLVATTVGQLLERNFNVLSSCVRLGEDTRICHFLFDLFPSPYREDAHAALDDFTTAIVDGFLNDEMTLVNLRKQTPLIEKCMRIVHEAGTTSATLATPVGEAFGALNRIRQGQSSLMELAQRRFPNYHYANLITLAVIIALVFLIETDPNVVTFAAEPQLALSWSLLVLTFSMLFVVIYDLTNPLGGLISRIIGMTQDLDRAAVERYTSRQEQETFGTENRESRIKD